jgi:hypothetical protein
MTEYECAETGRFSSREPNLQNIRPPGINSTLRDEFIRRMKYTDLKRHETYLYEVRENGVLYGTFAKYEDALADAKFLYGKGHTGVFIISKMSQEFDLTTSEEIKQEIDKDILTFQIDDIECELSDGRSSILSKLVALMNKYEIASFNLDLKEFTLKDGVHFARKREWDQ